LHEPKLEGGDDVSIEHIKPPELFNLDGFSQVVTASPGKLAFIAGQGAFDAEFNLVGAGDLHAQTLQAFKNLRIALAAVGATPEDVVSSNMYIVGLTPEAVNTFARAMNEALDGKPFPPNASTMLGVQSLAMEGMLVEVSAIARIP
jgi:enamine deaminase RidA (YjgF/YER057c/UK114 family)